MVIFHTHSSFFWKKPDTFSVDQVLDGGLRGQRHVRHPKEGAIIVAIVGEESKEKAAISQWFGINDLGFV